MDLKKKRLDYLDFSKCIAIFLVIWGHASPNGSSPAYRVALYSFHMPLFFLVSGMVVSRHRHSYDKEHWKNFIIKNITTLLVPYLIWGAIYSNFSCVNFIKLFYGSWEVINSIGTLTSLWFLPCLFTARILVEIVLMLSWKVKQIPRHLFGFFAAIGFFCIAFLMPKLPIGYPLCFNVACMASGLILSGYAIKGFVLNLPKTKAWIYLIAAAAFGGLLLFGQLIQGDEPFLMLMTTAKYGSPVMFFLNAFAGIGMVISFSVFLTVVLENSTKIKRFMLWTGRNTVGIFLLHKPFLQEVIMPAVSATFVAVPIALQCLIGATAAFVFAAAGCLVINRFVPALFGASKNAG